MFPMGYITSWRRKMANYLYKCPDCGASDTLSFPIGQAPQSVPCDCGEHKQRDIVAQYKSIQIIPLKECEQDENRITEQDLPTPEAVEALRRFASIPQGSGKPSSLIEFQISGGG